MSTGERVVVTVALALGLVAAPLFAGAQEAGKQARVGVLLLPPRAGLGGAYTQALREGLRELPLAPRPPLAGTR